MITRTLLAALKAVVALVVVLVGEHLVNLPGWADALIVAASVYLTPNVGYRSISHVNVSRRR